MIKETRDEVRNRMKQLLQERVQLALDGKTDESQARKRALSREIRRCRDLLKYRPAGGADRLMLTPEQRVERKNRQGRFAYHLRNNMCAHVQVESAKLTHLGIQVTIRCVYCGELHIHGAGDELPKCGSLGFRVPHCAVGTPSQYELMLDVFREQHKTVRKELA